jgi:hypothetical protein
MRELNSLTVKYSSTTIVLWFHRHLLGFSFGVEALVPVLSSWRRAVRQSGPANLAGNNDRLPLPLRLRSPKSADGRSSTLDLGAVERQVGLGFALKADMPTVPDPNFLLSAPVRVRATERTWSRLRLF